MVSVQDDLRNTCVKFQPIPMTLGMLAVFLVFRVEISLSRKPFLRHYRALKICGGNFETGPNLCYTMQITQTEVRTNFQTIWLRFVAYR